MRKILTVFRTFEDGRKIKIGQVGESNRGILFKWDEGYIKNHPNGNLSPFRGKFLAVPQLGPDHANEGLHGFLAESLPDGWGRLLMDRAFLAHKIDPTRASPIDRLAYVGSRAIGALSFEPEHQAANDADVDALTSLKDLGDAAIEQFDNDSAQVFKQLLGSVSSGGSRPKALIWPDASFQTVSTVSVPDREAWLVKFTSENLPFRHEEGLWEAAALTAAQRAGLRTVTHHLFTISDKRRTYRWLALRRFDRTLAGRIHFASAAGLMNVDFRTAFFDYVALFKMNWILTRSHTEAVELFRRAVFNFFLMNCDDHGKNFGWLLDGEGRWTLAPAYDLTHCPDNRLGNQHCTTFAGEAIHLSEKALGEAAQTAGLTASEVREIGEAAASAVETFVAEGRKLGAGRDYASGIREALEKNLALNLKAFRGVGL